jgi:hypothetical protein
VLAGTNTFAAGLTLTDNGTLTNSGTLTNAASIVGRQGAAGGSHVGGNGGIAIELASGSLSNSGTIAGGQGWLQRRIRRRRRCRGQPGMRIVKNPSRERPVCPCFAAVIPIAAGTCMPAVGGLPFI